MEEIIPVFKVSQLNRQIREILESSFHEIWVEGEISGLKKSSLGHIYFDLKDENSLISCVFFKWAVSKCKFDIENGLLVKVRADVTIYDKQSKYQLQIKELISLKFGPLQAAFEKLKEKLKNEGLFEQSRKRKIPAFPSKIAVVTSATGAAIRDILSILKRRCPNVSIILYPVKVQGEGAALEIASAIKELNENFSDIEVMLVGRGGGSIEDLWAFNEEIVAIAIAASQIPIISCVGHETDFTIADFVADLRAPTPSAAAELVAANNEDVLRHLFQMEKRLLQSLRLNYRKLLSRFKRFTQSRFFRNPYAIIEDRAFQVDKLAQDLFRAIYLKLEKSQNSLNLQREKLKNLSPYFPLKKGYSLVTKAGSHIKDASALKEGDEIDVAFYKSFVMAKVKKVKEKL